MIWTPEAALNRDPYKVLLKRGEFIDESRDSRPVPYKIYYPSDYDQAIKAPVIIWSHGFGGNRDGASFISRYVASHGYVIVHLTHLGTDSSLWEGKEGHPWDILRKAKISRETTLNRMYDVPFALDQLEHWAQENPDVGQIMDMGNIGMSGHSFGAMTTQVMAGMKFPDHSKELKDMRDKRIRAGILYSPVPIGHITDEKPELVYGPISIPLLHMTGTDDDSPLDGYDYTYRLVIHEHSGHPEKYLHILQDGDHMVYNGTRGKLGVNPNREIHEEEIMVKSLAFWEGYLKDESHAIDYLKSQGL